MSVSQTVRHRRLAACNVLLVISGALLSISCSNDYKVVYSEVATAASDLSVFDGCYTVSHDEPAQIKVSKIDGMRVMQMKEPIGSGRVWDDPEPLEALDNSEIPTYFSIEPYNVDAIIARPDRVLVLAHVKPVYANIDPLLDSEYLSYIYRGANTIYRVECDEINTDIVANPHANIVIDKVNKSI